MSRNSVIHKKIAEFPAYFRSAYANAVFEYEEKGRVGELEPMLVDFLAAIDTAKNGELSVEEIDEAAQIIHITKKAKENNSAEINYKHMPDAVAKVLAEWDADKSGSVSISELVMAADAQKKMKQENRLVKKLLVGAMIVILVLLAGTFALSMAAVEMGKETTTDQNTGIAMTKSGNPAAMGTAVRRVDITEFPSLGIERLKEMRDFGYVHDGAYHYRVLSAFAWYSETNMTLTALNGEELSIDNGILTLKQPNGQLLTVNPAALLYAAPGTAKGGRRLSNWAGALMTSGSFTMMASAGID